MSEDIDFDVRSINARNREDGKGWDVKVYSKTNPGKHRFYDKEEIEEVDTLDIEGAMVNTMIRGETEIFNKDYNKWVCIVKESEAFGKTLKCGELKRRELKDEGLSEKEKEDIKSKLLRF